MSRAYVVGVTGGIGSGKSTVSRAVAAKLGLEVLDTGAMYRAVTYAVLRDRLDPSEHAVIGGLARRIVLTMANGRVEVDGVDVTDIIRTPSGFHLFKLNEKRGGAIEQQFESQIHARHILLKTNEIEDDNTVKQRLEKIRSRILAGEDFATIAAVTSQDPGSAVKGGDLGWAGPGIFVGEFEKALDKLDDHQISEPFKTQFGWHIVQLLGRRTQDVSEDNKRNKAYAALRESKAEEAIELWVRELRANAYIEILL